MWRKRLTDEEYVEQLRKGLRVQRWLRYIHAAVGLLMIGLCLWAIPLFISILTTPGTPATRQSLIYMMFVLAGVLGLTVGFWFTQVAASIAAILFEHRKDKMLVECWDSLNELLAERDSST